MPLNAIIIGLIAGLAAALMLYSAAHGPSLAGFLLSLTSMLPIFLARLGWGLPTALIAALTGAGIFSLASTPAAGGFWLLSQVLPVLLLCHFAYLHREVAAGPTPATSTTGTKTITQWYPLGRLLTIAALIGGALASVSLLLLGQDIDAIRKTVKAALPDMLKKFPQFSEAQIDDARLEQFAEIAVYALPVATAIFSVMILLLNLWLAARITKASGRLQRPWPDIAAMQIAPITAIGLAMSLLLTYLGGMAGLVATAFAGALLFLYVCLGLAIIHHVTRANPYRGFILWATYGALLLFNTYAMLAAAAIGLAEPISPIKRRFAGPPPNPPGSPPRSGGPPTGTPPT